MDKRIINKHVIGSFGQKKDVFLDLFDIMICVYHVEFP